MPALLQTGRNQFVNVPSGALRDPVGGRGPAPSYALRMQGQALRDEYGAAAAEAAALSRQAPATQDYAYGQAQRIREAAIESARGQTVLHYKIRSQMANDLEQAAARQDERVRAWAELALRGDMHRADQALKARGLNLDERAFERRGEEFQQEYGLKERGLEADIQDKNADRKLRVAEGLSDVLEKRADRSLRQKQFDREMQYREKTDARRDAADLARSYDPKTVSAYMKTGNPSTLEPRERPRSLNRGWAHARSRALGIDTGSFLDPDTGTYTQEFRDFVDVANTIRAENPDWNDDEVLWGAAEELGLGAGATGTSKRWNAAEPPVWSDKAGGWVVQDPQTGRWFVNRS